MRKVVIALGLGLFAVVAADSARAEACADFQGGYRPFTGRIDKIDDKQMIVDNRKGDKVKFNRVDDSKVETDVAEMDEKKAWDDLKAKSDWVTVYWKFIDKPRKAYCVQVIPARDEDE